MHLMVTKRELYLFGQVTFPLLTPLSKYTLGLFPCPQLTHYGNYFGEMMAKKDFYVHLTIHQPTPGSCRCTERMGWGRLASSIPWLPICPSKSFLPRLVLGPVTNQILSKHK